MNFWDFYVHFIPYMGSLFYQNYFIKFYRKYVYESYKNNKPSEDLVFKSIINDLLHMRECFLFLLN